MLVIRGTDSAEAGQVVCDDEDCDARTSASRAEAAGWAMALTLGPHLCPACVNRRFFQRMTETFADPLP